MTTITDATTHSRAEIRTLGEVSAAHLVSHIYWIAFVPILPDLRELLGVSYTDLASAITLMNLISALTQAPIGFLCDRIGPRVLLVSGLCLGGLSFLAIGVWPSYPILIGAAIAIGLANAVYHPADYSILAAEMSESRMGRAFSIHAFMGYLGFAVAPPLMLAASHFGGARLALALCGAIGPLVALPFLFDGGAARGRGARSKTASGAPRASALSLLTPPVVLLTVMYTTLSLGTGVLQTFMIVALGDLFHMPRDIADWSLTLFMSAMVAGVLAGGFVADRVKRQSIVTSGGFGLSAALIVAVATFEFGPYPTLALMALAGFLAGLIMPSRDMLTRAASPPGAVGRVFGIVTTGFNFGGMAGPLIGAWFIDHRAPSGIFYISAVFMAITIALAIQADANGRRQPEKK